MTKKRGRKKSDYYVYLYLDPTRPGKWKYYKMTINNEPFYVGKGHLRRAYCHLNIKHGSNMLKKERIKSILNLGLEPIIVKYRENIKNKTAMNIEKRMIKYFGRIDLKTGILTNRTNGGDGCDGFVHLDSTKKYLSEIRKGKSSWNKGLTKETDNRVKINSEHTQKTIKKERLFVGKKNPMFGKIGKLNPNYGKNRSEEQKKKYAVLKIGLNNPQSKLCVIIAPDGKKFKMCITDFIRQFGEYYDIKKSFLYYTSQKGNRNNKGWKVRYLKNKGNIKCQK